jgi:tetratricopeptide (TPR) repeat protein
VVEDLLRFDFLTSPRHDIERHVLVGFGHDVAAIAAGTDAAAAGAVPPRRESYMLFRKTDRASTNFFNGRFVTKSYRDVPAATLGSAKALREAGLDPAEVVAVAEWHLAGERADVAATIAGDVLKRSPRQTDAMHVLAQAAAARGQLDSALNHLRRAIKARPDVAAYHVTQGNLCAAVERFPEAIRAFEKAAALAPHLVEPRFNVGVCLAQAGRMDEAVAALRDLVADNPDLAAGHFVLGQVLMAAGRPVEALSAYQRVLELHPDHPDAREGIAEARQAILQSAPVR